MTVFNCPHLLAIATVLRKGQQPSFLHAFQKRVCWLTDFYLASVLSSCTLLLLSILTIKTSWSWITHHSFLRSTQGVPTDLFQVSGPKHMTLTAVRWGTKGTTQHLPQSMPFTVLSPEVCLPFWYPRSDWLWQLEGGPSHCLYHISNARQAFEAGSHALQLSGGSFKPARLQYLQCLLNIKTEFLAHLILTLLK